MKIYPPRGFSLVEVLTVIALLSITLMVSTFSIQYLEKKRVQSEINRFKRIVGMVVDRSIILRRPMTIEVYHHSYQIKELWRSSWKLMQDEGLAPYSFKYSLRASINEYPIYFNSSGLAEPHSFTMSAGKMKYKYLISINEFGNVEISDK